MAAGVVDVISLDSDDEAPPVVPRLDVDGIEKPSERKMKVEPQQELEVLPTFPTATA